MPLKLTVATLDEVPEALRSAYVEKDGKFFLDAEGIDPEGKQANALKREREARAAAEKAVGDLKKQMEGLDPAKAREALKIIQDLEDKNLLGEGKIEELVAKRVERIAAEAKTEREKLNGENRTLTSKLEELLIDNAIRAAATKVGVRSTAVEDAVLLGKTVWKLKDGVPVPMRGTEILYGKEANKPMTVDEWISERATDRAHWFEPHAGGAGGGATGSTTRAEGNVVTLARDKAKDPAAYRAAKEQAAKAGVELVLQ